MSPHIAEYVYAPRIYWNLSTSKLLTMEFMNGAEITDVSTIQRLGIRPIDVSKLVSGASIFFANDNFFLFWYPWSSSPQHFVSHEYVFTTTPSG